MNPELPHPPGEPQAVQPAPPPPPAPQAPPPEDGAAPARKGAALASLLSQFQTRHRRLLYAEAALWGVAAALLLCLGAGYAARAWIWAGQALLWLVPVALAAALFFLGALRVRRLLGDDERAARRLGAATGALGDDALSAVELSRAGTADGRFSRSLAEAFLEDVDRRAATQSAAALVDARRTRRAGWALLGALLVATAALVIWPRPWMEGMALALGTDSRPAPPVRHEPITGDVEITYRYPAYTGLAPRTVPGASGEISAPAGTQVTLRTRSDRPVRRAEVVVNGQALPLQVEKERDLEGSFVLDAPGAYHFRFLNALGGTRARGPDLPINVEADAAPKVELLLPKSELEIDPGEEVVLRYEATDDFGITGLELVFRGPGGKEKRETVPKEDGRATRQSWRWNLSGLGLKPGDAVTYHLEAKDNDAVAGPKRGVSRTQVVRIYSAAEHRREALRKAEALWHRMIVQLADRLEGGDLESPLELGRVKAQTRVDEAGWALAQELLTVAGELSEQKDAPPELVTALVNIADGYGKAARSTGEVRRMFLRFANRFDLAGDFGRRLNRTATAEVEELEKDILYLESLIDRRKLQELKELADELVAEQRELASLIEDYQKTKDPEARQRVMEQISALRDRIDQLNQRMQELRKSIRDEHLNAEALQAMMEQGSMEGMLDEIERLMREGKTEEALKKLQELSMQLDELQERLDEGQDSFGEEQFPELARKFGDFMEDLEETRARQQAVAEQTRKMRDRYREKMRERLEEKGEALKDELIKKVEKAAQEYGDLDPDRLSYSSEEDLSQVQRELENARNALQVEDFDLAAEAASRAERAAQELSLYGEQQRQLDEAWRNPPEVQAESRALAEKLGENEERVREVNRALQQLFPPAGQMMSQEDQKQLRELAQEQRQLRQKAEGLQQQMQELSQMAPIFDDEAQRQMEQVGERMGDATQRMQARDPGRGYGEQRAAMEGLRRFEEQMQQSLEQKQGQRGLPLPMMAGRRPGSGGRSSQEEVEIPDAEQYQAPKEFRKDILDAMKQGAPEKYQEQVKRYYEELVK